MTDTLPVHLNRQELHSLEVPASFETGDSFVIAVQNHGEAGRIHVHLDDGLSDVASVPATNHYVRANDTTEIPVAVHDGGPVHGKVKLVSGYGAVTRWVDVTVTEPEESGPVAVEEDLARPPADRGAEGSGGVLARLADRPAVPVVALGVLALVVAVVATLAVRDAAVAASAALVVVAILAAGAWLLR
ncbi:MAG: hypothetical protein ABEJ30_04575 [Halorientalis sp.]